MYKTIMKSPSEQVLSLRGSRYGMNCGITSDISTTFYTVEPYVTEFDVISLCTAGHIVGVFEGREEVLRKNDFCLLLNDSKVEYKEISEDFGGKFIFLETNYARQLKYNDFLPVFLFFKEHPIVHLSDEEHGYLLDLFNLIEKTISSEDNQEKDKMLRMLFKFLHQVVQGLKEFKKGAQQIEKGRMMQLFEKFQALLKKHHKESREALFYADKLFISPNYLYKVTREITGMGTKAFIEEYVISEAKYQLLNEREKTIQEIALGLGFSNQSSFGKYFKQNMGVSPSEFRKK